MRGLEGYRNDSSGTYLINSLVVSAIESESRDKFDVWVGRYELGSTPNHPIFRYLACAFSRHAKSLTDAIRDTVQDGVLGYAEMPSRLWHTQRLSDALALPTGDNAIRVPEMDAGDLYRAYSKAYEGLAGQLRNEQLKADFVQTPFIVIDSSVEAVQKDQALWLPSRTKGIVSEPYSMFVKFNRRNALKHSIATVNAFRTLDQIDKVKYDIDGDHAMFWATFQGRGNVVHHNASDFNAELPGLRNLVFMAYEAYCASTKSASECEESMRPSIERRATASVLLNVRNEARNTIVR